METFWYLHLRFRRAYDSNFFLFSEGHMHSYNSDYDSDYMYDSVTTENQSWKQLNL